MKNRLFLIVIVLLFNTDLFADIYQYKDENGVLHFTDSPTQREFALYIKNKKTPYSSTFYDKVIMDASIDHKIPFSLIKAIIKVESDFNRHAISSKGAMGLMQLMPFNIKTLDIRDPFDPFENIMGGTAYFRKMLKRFNGNVKLAIAAYNAGPTAVSKYNAVPPFPETKRFVHKVIRYNYKYRKKEQKI